MGRAGGCSARGGLGRAGSVGSAAAAVPAAPTGRTVFLTINSNRNDVGLWQRGWDKPFCLAPCNMLVPAGASLGAGGWD